MRPSKRGRGLTLEGRQATPRSWFPRGAEKLVEASLTGENPGGEIRSRPRSIPLEDFHRGIEKS